MTDNTVDDETEFSRPLRVDSLHIISKTIELEASIEECRQLALRYGVISVISLKATLHLSVSREERLILVEGDISAELRQICVVTHEEVDNKVSTALRVKFSESPDISADSIKRNDDIEDFTTPDPPETIENGTIDLGELVSQYLSTAIDPYPRKHGLPYNDYSSGKKVEDDVIKAHPFSALAELKDKLR